SAARPDRPPLVGRDDELAFLRAQWRNTVRNGRASIVLLCGEAGVGTTRLVDELAEEVADTAMVVRAVYPAYGRLGGLRVAPRSSASSARWATPRSTPACVRSRASCTRRCVASTPRPSRRNRPGRSAAWWRRRRPTGRCSS